MTVVDAMSQIPLIESTASPTLPNPAESLWYLAALQLKAEDRPSIEVSSSFGLDELLESVNNKKEECEQRKWTFSKGRNNNTINLRDVIMRIAKWVEKFIAVGDVAVQYDPGHAALPWAAVRFLLQVSVSDVRRYAIVLEGLETISSLLVYYDIHGQFYLRPGSRAIEPMKKSLVRLYVLVLRFLAKAKQYYSLNTAGRMAKSFTQFTDKFQIILEQINHQRAEVDRCATLADAELHTTLTNSLEILSLEERSHYQRLRAFLDDLQQPIFRIEKRILDLQGDLEENERLKVLDWISTMPYMKHHDLARRNILDGTGMWLLGDHTVTEWRNTSHSSILWLHGKIGSGKTKLVAILIQQVLEDSRSRENPFPLYVYCARNAAELERSDPVAIFASLLRQMSVLELGGPILYPVVARYYEKKKEGFLSSLVLEEIVELIISLTDYHCVTTIIIDALDECTVESQHDILEALQRVIQKSEGLVRVFVSSRQNQDIVCTLEGCPNLEITASKNQKDVVRFVEHEVDYRISTRRLLLGQVSPDLKELITRELCEGAQGMFRWVSLQLQYLCTLKLPNQVQKRLGQLPRELSKLYDEIYTEHMDDHTEEERQITDKIFKWLLCSQSPLTSDELISAVSPHEEGEEEGLTRELMLRLCFNFVIYDKDLGIFRFAHLSVREYLEKKSLYDVELCHMTAAQCCLERLCSSNSIPSMDFAYNEFFTYSAIYWMVHCKLAGRHRLQGELGSLFYHFAVNPEPTPEFRMWHEFMMDGYWAPKKNKTMKKMWLEPMRDSICAKPTSFFVACVYDFREVVSTNCTAELLQARNLNGDTCLHVACLYNNLPIVDELIKLGADLNTENRYGHTPLHLAVSGGQVEIARSLLTRPENVTLEILNAAAINRPCGTAMMQFLLCQSDDAPMTEEVFALAASNDQSGRELMQFLLDRYRYVRITEKTAVAAARNEFHATEILRLLLARPGSIEITESVLKAAAENWHEGSRLFQLLIEQGLQVQITQGVLEIAAYNEGCGDLLIALIMEQLQDVHITEIVLRSAARNTSKGKQILEMLLSQTESVKITQSILKEAARNTRGHGVMLLLLNQPHGQNVTDHILATAAANRSNGRLILQTLLEQVPELRITEEILNHAVGNPDCKDILPMLLSRSQENIVTLETYKMAARHRDGKELIGILHNHASNLQITENADILWEAAGNGELDVIRLFQDEFGLPDVEYFLLVAHLYNAVRKGSHTATHHILSQGVNVNCPDRLGRTPLWWAVCQSNLAIVTELLSVTGIDVDSGAATNETPLIIAAEDGNIEMVRLLLQHGANPDIPLLAASMKGYDKVVRILLDNGARVNTHHTYHAGETALQSASYRDHKDIVQMLLDSGAEIDIEGGHSGNALQAACAEGHERVVQLLIDRGINVGVKTYEGYGHAMNAAASNGKIQVMKLLLLENQQLNGEGDIHGVTPLHRAFLSNQPGSVDFLLGLGSNPRIRDKQGRECIHFAALNGSTAGVKSLVNLGIDLNTVDGDGWTPLHWAAMGGSAPTVKVLLSAGANKNISSKRHWKARDVAMAFQNPELAGLLTPLSSELDDRQNLQSIINWAEEHTQTNSSGDLTDDLLQLMYYQWDDSVCDGCEQFIRGPRYKCSKCKDFDFCFKCHFTSNTSHPLHEFKFLSPP